MGITRRLYSLFKETKTDRIKISTKEKRYKHINKPIFYQISYTNFWDENLFVVSFIYLTVIMGLDYIFRRRSIRKRTDKIISDEQIRLILECAMAVPAAHNIKPWHFIVVKNREVLNKIKNVHPYGNFNNIEEDDDL